MALRIPQLWKFPAAAHPGRDVCAALAVKSALLLAIYLLFFGPGHRSPADAVSTANALIGINSPKAAP